MARADLPHDPAEHVSAPTASAAASASRDGTRTGAPRLTPQLALKEDGRAEAEASRDRRESPMLKRYAALSAAVLAVAVLVPAASADPLKAKNSLAFPATCDDGQTVQVVVNGQGEFTPAHVVGTTAVFVPQAFDITFEFTPTGGTTETETDASSKPHVHGDLVTCSFDVTQSFPFGTLHLFGTATGFFTPAS